MYRFWYLHISSEKKPNGISYIQVALENSIFSTFCYLRYQPIKDNRLSQTATKRGRIKKETQRAKTEHNTPYCPSTMVEINSTNSKVPLLPIHEEETTTNNNNSSVLRSIIAKKYIQIASGPLACGLICLFVDEPSSSRNMLAVLAWVFLWWLTEAVPMAITSMSPLFLFPLFGVSSADDVVKAYMDDVISLVLGSFILALAIEHYNIHKRLALNVSEIYDYDRSNSNVYLIILIHSFL